MEESPPMLPEVKLTEKIPMLFVFSVTQPFFMPQDKYMYLALAITFSPHSACNHAFCSVCAFSDICWIETLRKYSSLILVTFSHCHKTLLTCIMVEECTPAVMPWPIFIASSSTSMKSSTCISKTCDWYSNIIFYHRLQLVSLVTQTDTNIISSGSIWF